MRDKKNFSLTIEPEICIVWLPVLVGALLTLLTGFLWWTFDRHENDNLKKNLQAEAEYLVENMEEDLNSRLPFLRSIARRWEIRGEISKDEFEIDANSYLSNLRGSQSLDWVDKDFFVRWIVPIEGNEKILNLNLAFEPHRRSTMEKAKLSRSAMMTSPLDLVQGGKGFLIFFPIHLRDEFHGFILGQFRFQEWLEYVVNLDEHHDLKNNVRILAYMDGLPVFRHEGWEDTGGQEWTASADIQMMNHHFSIHVRPIPSCLEQRKSIIPELIFFLGILLSFLIPFIIYLLQKSYLEAWRIHEAKKTLENEVQERKKAENQLQETLSRLDMAAKAGGIGVWSLDLVSNVLTLNETIYNLFNVPPDFKLNNETWINALHPDDVDATLALFRNAIKGKAVFKTEFRVIFSETGLLRYLGVAARVERDSLGKPLRMNGISWDLTALKKAEETLKRSEAQVRLLLNSTAEAIYGIDLQGNCTFANSSCLRIIGYSDLAHVLGRNMHDLIHHSYADGRRMPVEICRIYKAFREGKGEHVDDEVLWRADGTCFPAEYWSFPQIESGKVMGAVVTFNDITERKEAEDSLISSRKQYQDLVETLHDWVWEVDLRGNYTYVSPQVKNILGYEPCELLGKAPFDFMPPEEKKRVLDLYTPLIIEEKPIFALENMNIHKDGRRVLLETNGFPFYDTKGNLKGYRGADRDITKRKEAETELRHSEEKFASAFHTSPYAIIISRMDDGTFLEVNGAFELLTGLSRAEVINQTSIKLKLWVNEKDREEVISTLRKGLPVIDREFHFRNKNGDILTGLYSSQIIQLAQGNCILSSINNITERKKMEEDLRENRRFLSELIEHSGTLICVKDKEGRYELVNSKWEETTGLKRENTLGKTDEELFPGLSGKLFRQNDLEVMKSGSVLEKEEVLENGHGKRFFISIKFPLRVDSGEIRGICAMITEITERKYTEKLLSLERQRLSFIIEGTHLGTWEWNVQTGRIIVNERWAGMIGYALEEIAPVTIVILKNFIHPDDLKISDDLIEKHLRKELDYYECEVRMQHKNGSWIWVLQRGKISTWDNDGKPLVMSGTHLDITERKNSEEKILHMATHDGLTDLPSLRLVRDRILMAMKTARRYKSGAAVMFIDLDGFKEVNDTYGHDIGDEVLIEIAKRLRSSVRETDTVARIGGDEFLIVLTELKIPENASIIAEKVLQRVSKPIRINNYTASVSASIGIAFFPHDGDNVDSLIKRADETMYETKKSGKNGYGFAKIVSR